MNEEEDMDEKPNQEEEEIEEEDTQDTLNEPNLIWNESKETGWGKCYFKILNQDPLFGKGKTIRHPFYINEEGLILQRHPSLGQNRVYIPDSKL